MLHRIYIYIYIVYVLVIMLLYAAMLYPSVEDTSLWYGQMYFGQLNNHPMIQISLHVRKFDIHSRRYTLGHSMTRDAPFHGKDMPRVRGFAVCIGNTPAIFNLELGKL